MVDCLRCLWTCLRLLLACGKAEASRQKDVVKEDCLLHSKDAEKVGEQTAYVSWLTLLLFLRGPHPVGCSCPYLGGSHQFAIHLSIISRHTPPDIARNVPY